MKKILYTTTAFILCGLAQSHAACIPTPSCTSLGYTSTTSCTGGIKCPFGNYWNCEAANSTTKITELTNKITELEEKIKKLGTGGCEVGTILYSDKSCSNVAVTGKTPIGVVVYTDEQGHGQAIALKDISSYFFSLTYSLPNPIPMCRVTIPTISDFSFSTTANEAFNDFNSCGNTAKLVATSKDYTAANTIHKYSTVGTSAGDWCLPAAGILKSISENYQIIQNSLNLAGGDELGGTLTSNMKDEYTYWYMDSFEKGVLAEGTDFGAGTDCTFSYNHARPVLEF